ncbi:SDR family oxidoreductase [Anaerolineales bacterium]
MSKIAVVTGGAGFIGSHIAEALLAQGYKVRVFDNLSTGKRDNITYLEGLSDDFTFHNYSITNAGDLLKVFEGAEVVFHQAAIPSVPLSIEQPLLIHEHCATGTLNVLEAARKTGVKRVIYAASSAAYGLVGQTPQVETMSPDPISPYGVAKLMGEYYCRVYTEIHGLETVCLRYFNVFGARQDLNSPYAAVIPIFMRKILKGETPLIFGDGEQTRDFIYIKNVVHGNLLAMQSEKAVGQVINMATGTSISLNELMTKINQVMGTNVEPIHEAERSGDIKYSYANIDKAGDLLGYEPVVDFDTALAETAAYYRKEMGLPDENDDPSL